MGSAAATAAALMGWAAPPTPPTPPFRRRTLTSLTQKQTDNGIREEERDDTFSLQLQGGQVAASNHLNFVFRVRSKE